MFKADWEKTSTIHPLAQGMVKKMLRLAYPDKKLMSHELITGGWSLEGERGFGLGICFFWIGTMGYCEYASICA